MNNGVRRIGIVIVLASSMFAMAPALETSAAGECPAGWTFSSVSKTCSQTFVTATGQSTTGSSYSWTVPSGTTSIDVSIIGARGGNGGNDSQAGGAAGQVGKVSGTLAVSAGTTLGIHVGGIGTNGTTCQDWCGQGLGGDNPLSGYDGGNGANAGCTFAQCGAGRGSSGAGGGGGAASVLVVGANTIVAAGGGGGGGGSQFATGFAGSTGSVNPGTTSGASADNYGPNHAYAGVGGGGGGGANGGYAGAAAANDNSSAYGGSAGSNSNGGVAGLSTSFVAAQVGSITITYTPQLAPLATASPTVGATPMAGVTTTGTNATFAGLAGTNSLQWLVCSSPSSATNTSTTLTIPSDCRLATGAGATTVNYVPTVSDVGSYLRLASTMTNSEGDYTSISATSTNPVGVPPTTAPDLQTTSDLGTSSTDNVTSDNTPSLVSSSLVIGATVTMTATDGASTLSCSFVATSTTQGCDLGTLTDGTWTISTTQTAGSLTTTPASTTITIDTVPPPITSTPDLKASSDLGSSSTDDITSDNTPLIDVPGVANGVVVTITATQPGYPDVSCTYTTPTAGCSLGTLADGAWNIVASTNVTDEAGNPAPISPPLPITVQTSAVSGVAVDLHSDSDSGTSTIDNFTRLQTINVGVPNVPAGFTVVMTGTKSGQTTVTCTYIASPTVDSCALGTLAEGTWNVSATVTDPLIAVTDIVAALPVVVDVSAPAAPAVPDLATASDSGVSSTDDITRDSTPLINVPSVANGLTVTVTATRTGFSPVSCTYVASATTTGCDLGVMADGPWNVAATVTDAAGNESQSSTPLVVTIDTTPLSAPATFPDLLPASDSGTSNSDNITSDKTPTVAGSGGINGDVITLTVTDGVSTYTCSYAVGVATSCDMPELADGVWLLTSTLTDMAGNVSAPSPALSITIDTNPGTQTGPDLVEISDTGISSIDNITRDATPAVAGTGGFVGDTVTLTVVQAAATHTCSYVLGLATSCDMPTLTDGVWIMTSIISDAAGNVSAVSATTSLVIDSVAPAAPAVPDLATASDSGASSTDDITRDSTPLINVPSVANGLTVTVTATRTGFSPVLCTYVASATTTGCDLGVMADGPWIVAATVTDAAGNESQSSTPLVVTIDTTPPFALSTTASGVALATPNIGSLNGTNELPDLLAKSDTGISSADNVTTDANPRVSQPTAKLGETVTMTVTRSGFAPVTCTYRVTVETTSCQLQGLATGTWSLTATTTDIAGNVGESQAVPVTISDIVGLPNVDRTQFSSRLTQTSALTTVSVTVPERAGAIAVRSFIVAVLNKNGNVIRRETIKVAPGRSSASFVMPRSSGAASVVVHAINEFGVSDRAPIGASVRHQKPSVACPKNGSVAYETENLFDRVIFEPASPVLDRIDRVTLDKVAQHLRNRGGVVIVSGYARRNGIDSDKFLKNLSMQRARNVSMYLSTKGVRTWVDFEGYGAVTKRIGTSLDRRVDICWTSTPDLRAS